MYWCTFFGLEKIVLTHSHWDHIGDVAVVKEKYDVPVLIHQDDAQNLERPGSDGLPLFFPVPGVKPTTFLKEGDLIEVGKMTFKVIHTPGHSPGGICLYDKESGVLISGDTLFKGSIGNLSLPTAEPEKMWKSLEKLNALPKETQVFPGHGPATTLQGEPWLSRAKEVFS